MSVEENPAPENVKSQIVIEFPGGPHTTSLSAQYVNVDPAQIELAGAFLNRTGIKLQDQAEANAMANRLAVARQLPNLGRTT